MDFEEAAQDKRWRDAMDEEITSIKKNDTWELVSLLIASNFEYILG